MSKQTLWGLLGFAAFVAVIVYMSLGTRRYSCEVCVTFRGQSDCRRASGNDRGEAIATATDNACALMVSGREESIRCGNTPPISVKCEER